MRRANLCDFIRKIKTQFIESRKSGSEARSRCPRSRPGRLPHKRVGNPVQLECSDSVDAGAAYTAGFFTALVARPRKLIGNVKLQATLHDVRLRPLNKRRFHVKLAARSLDNGVVHGIDELLRAIGIGVARPIVVMRTVIQHGAPQ